MPASGGLRVILISGIDGGTGAPAPAVPAVSGTVAFGPNSRVIAQFQEDALQVFYLMELVNEQRAPVDIGGPVLLELPRGAAGAAVMAGSSPSVTVNGDLLTVLGPFQPGTTSVQVGFTLPHSSPNLTIEQDLARSRATDSPWASSRWARCRWRRRSFSRWVRFGPTTARPTSWGELPPLPAGATLTVSLSGLPVHSTLPRNIAIALALLVLASGVWLARQGRVDDAQLRARLAGRRDTLLGDLARLEARRGDGRESERDAARRQRLVGDLEQIYAELDQSGAGPPGGGEDVAA